MIRLLLLSLFLMSGCIRLFPKQDHLELTKAQMFRSLISGTNFKIPERSIVNQHHLTKFPVLTWSPVIAWQNFEKEGAPPVTYCAFYLIPKLGGTFSKKGILKFIRATDTMECDNLYVRDAYAIIRDVTELKFFVSGGKGKVDGAPPYTVQIKGKSYKDFDFSFPLYNLVRGELGIDRNERKYEHKQFSSSVVKSRIFGLRTRYPNVSGGINTQVGNFMIGSVNDSYPENTAILCHEVDENCLEKKPFFCEQCKFGWFEVTGPKCGKIGSSKYCSPYKCGQKGWPACHRGYTYEQEENLRGCVDKSTSGFCKKGLIPYCLGKNVLVCR